MIYKYIKIFIGITIFIESTIINANVLNIEINHDEIKARSIYDKNIVENKIDNIDVYKLSSHAHKLYFNKMLSHDLLIKFKQNKSTQAEILNIIIHVAKEYDLDKELIAAIVKTESSFDVNAISLKGAIGAMQLMPDTALELQVQNPYDPFENINAGTKYLKKQLISFKDLKLSLAAYNAGPNNVKKYKGIPPFPETQNYVNKVLYFYDKYKKEGINF